MSDKHISSQFDAQLDTLCAKVLYMGDLVEAQLRSALNALSDGNENVSDTFIGNEERIDALEVEIDADCANVIALRQPTARDLRLVLGTSRMVSNLERAGDEAEKVMLRTGMILRSPIPYGFDFSEVKISGDMAVSSLRKSLAAFRTLDSDSAAAIVREDKAIDAQFRGFVRKLMTHMMEDPKTISVSLDFLFVAKAIERFGDHAKNFCESVIYVAKGWDVRHGHLTQGNA